jgi:hypothetical protein
MSNTTQPNPNLSRVARRASISARGCRARISAKFRKHFLLVFNAAADITATTEFDPNRSTTPHDQSGTQGTGIQALAQVTTPIIKLPMKIRRQCGRCGDFNSVLVEPGQAVPAFKCSACGYAAG